MAGVEVAGEKQIPFGNDNKKSKGNDNGKRNGKSRFPSGHCMQRTRVRALALPLVAGLLGWRLLARSRFPSGRPTKKGKSNNKGKVKG